MSVVVAQLFPLGSMSSLRSLAPLLGHYREYRANTQDDAASNEQREWDSEDNAENIQQRSESVVGILAVLAQAERKAISERTKAALAAAKRRGVTLGNPRLRPGTEATALAASKATSEAARVRAEELRDVVDEARSKGCASLRQIAEHLNSQGFTTPRGGRWAAASVARLMAQLAPRVTG